MVCISYPKKFKEVPVTSSICFILIFVFILYSMVIIKDPCGDDIKSLFLRNFVSQDIVQLIINIFALYQLSTIELQIGSYKFLNLVILSIILNTILEWYVHKKYTDLQCSIGFSNIIITLLIFNFMMAKTVNINTMTVLILLMIVFTVENEDHKQSLLYVDGAIIGWFVFWLFKHNTHYS